jgi:predicted CxxxxCH...CXXCH cytochrome family protein
MKKGLLLFLFLALSAGAVIILSDDAGFSAPPPPPPPPPPTIGDGLLLKRPAEETCHACHKTNVNTPSPGTAGYLQSDWDNAIKMHSAELLGTCSNTTYVTETACKSNGGTWTPNKWNIAPYTNIGWGVSSGSKYGQIFCTTCHTSHNTTNIYLIKGTITSPNAPADSFPGSTVDFRYLSGTAGSAPYVMGDDTGGHATSTRVCEVCHSQTKYHNYNTGNNTGGLTHNNAAGCNGCHNHKKAFSGGGCTGCHGDPPQNGTIGPPGIATPATGVTSPSSAGAHVFHATTRVMLCEACHTGGMPANAIPSYTIDMGFTLNSTNVPNFNGAITTGTVSGRAPAAPYTGWGAAPGTTVNITSADPTCSIYCHGSTMPTNGGLNTTPSWTAAAGAYSCASTSNGACHGASLLNPPSLGNHQVHAGSGGVPDTTGGMQIACTTCHADFSENGPTHVNGSADWRFNTTTYPWLTGALYKGLSTGSATPVPSAYGQCSNLYCHSIVQTATGGPLTGAAGEYLPQSWGGSMDLTSCVGCHQGGSSHHTGGLTTTITSGSHTRHLQYSFNPAIDTNNRWAFKCVICHKYDQTAALTDCNQCHGQKVAKHANHSIDVAFDLTFGNGTYNGSPVPGSGWVGATCSNTYCHSNGTSVATGVIPANTSPNWGSGTLACNACHGVGGPVTGAPNYANLKKSAGTAVGTNWTTPANVTVCGNAYAIFNGTTQNYLFATQFGYTTSDVPDGATVTGIAVVIEGNGTSATAAQRQIRVALTKTGAAVVGTPKTGITLNQTSDTQIVIGGTTDLWGTTLTPAEVRATTFGVAISDNDTTAAALNISCLKIVVFTNTAPKMNSHANHSSKTCDVCHNTVTTDGTTIASTTLHNNGAYDLSAKAPAAFTYAYTPLGGTCSTVSCHGNVQWGASTLGCVDCHSQVVNAPNASAASGGTVTTRAAVVGEFGLAWGHKKSGRGAVANADCIVCHLEGDFTTQKPSAYHGDGYIDLRDPDGAGETRITDMSGASFRFVQFSTSYAAGSRTTTGQTSNNVDNVLTQKFCLACHDSNGATNTTARSNNGGTGTQYMPFGGVNLGATYTVANGAAAAGGLIDVKTQTATTNSSFHPVQGPKFKGYPTQANMVAPYNNFTRTAGTKANGVVINCFDCHNTPVTPLTARTVAAHGNANSLRGTIYVANPTLCQTCHPATQYGGTNGHGANSAYNAANGNMTAAMFQTCNYCHSSTVADPGRPIRAFNYHGFNKLLSGANWPTVNKRPYAFIRNTENFANHNPAVAATPDTTTAVSAQCTVSSAPNGTCSGHAFGSYTPGGQY